VEGCCWNGSEKHHQAVQGDLLILSLLLKTHLIFSKFTGDDEEEGCRAPVGASTLRQPDRT